MQTVLNDTTYAANIFKTDVHNKAQYNSDIILAAMNKKYKLTKDAREEISALLYEKEKKNAVYDYAYRVYSPENAAKQAEISLYYDSLINRILYSEGVNAPNSEFFKALQNKRALKLTKGQVDTLVEKGFELEQKMELALKENSAAFDDKKFERDNISRILSEDQYTKYLTIKNKEKALFYAKKDWNDILQYGLAEPSDSARLFKQIHSYQLARCVATDRYVDDPSRRKANHNAIDATMPKIEASLKAARKWTSKSGNAMDTKKYQGTFQW
jgi:hypothetical protein